MTTGPDNNADTETIVAGISTAVFNSLPVVIMTTKGELATLSPEFQLTFACAEEPQVYTHFRSFIELRMHPDDRQRVLEHYERWPVTPRPAAGVIFRATGADRRYRSYEMRILPLGNNGETGYMLLFQDITKRVLAEATVENLREIIQVVAHELKNMAGSLRLNVDLLIQGGTGLWRQTSEKVERDVERINRLIEDLLEFSRLERGNFRLQLTEIDLNEIVRDVVESFRPFAAVKGIQTFQVTLSDNFPRAIVDNLRLAQVIANLIINAVNYTPNGGTIRVITGKLREDDECYKIIVYDSGPGIPPDEIETIFDRGRGSIGKKSGVSGTGLGLWISREIIRSHGGDLIVETKYDPSGESAHTYSAFQIILPVSEGGGPGLIFSS